MYLSKHKNGYYYIYYDDPLNLKRRSISTKTKIKSNAIKFLIDFREQVKSRRDSGIIPITLERFIRVYLIYSSSIHTEKTTKAFMVTFNHVKKYFGNIQLNSLNRKKIENYIQFRIHHHSIYAARKDLINMSSAFTKAISENYILENPCKNIKRIRIPEKQPKFFSHDEYNRLISLIDEDEIKNIVELAVNTGMRQMELVSLRWEQVNLDDSIITLNNRNHVTKGKKIRTIPLNIRASEILDRLHRNRRSCYVFTKDNERYHQDYVSKKFKMYIRKAHLDDDYNFHTLRHTFASWLVQKGFSIFHVSKLLGHSTVATTQIYAHLRRDDLRRSMELLE